MCPLFIIWTVPSIPMCMSQQGSSLLTTLLACLSAFLSFSLSTAQSLVCKDVTLFVFFVVNCLRAPYTL